MTILQYRKENNTLSHETEIDILLNPDLCRKCHENLNNGENKMGVEGGTVSAGGSLISDGSCYSNSWIILRIFWKRLLAFVPFLIVIGYIVFVGFALYYDPQGAIFVCIVAVFVIYLTLNKLTRNSFSKQVGRTCKRLCTCFRPKKRISIWIRRISTIVCVLGLAAFLVYDIWDDLEKWVPLGGLAIFVIISVLCSENPSKINWIPVIWGLLLQFGLGLFILRWPTGFQACKWLGDQVTTFLGYTDEGSKFVFGEKYTYHPVVFVILPVVVFFSAMVSFLYYVGFMQKVIKAIAVVLQFALKTTPIESFATALHIFVGQIESSVALKPFLMKLTRSELHALMTSGFATVAGTVIAAYVEFGVRAEHVISASFMSAPAALAIAKLSIPETEESKIKSQKEIELPSGQETNLIEALSVGATIAIKLIAYVVVNLIAFVAVIAFLDAVVAYLGGRVGHPELNFQVICSYVFMPLAVIIGIPWKDCQIVGKLIGKKVIINEFLAFADLGGLIKNGDLGGRSAVISTYILCGFGSVAALGINLGALSSAAPERRSEFAGIMLRSMINGNIACFMTACIAGLLYQEIPVAHELSSLVNTTITTDLPQSTLSTVV